MGIQEDFTKYCCSFCLWDSHAAAEYYVRRHWPARDPYTPGIANIRSIPLANSKDVFMLTLQIKLGLMKNFVKILGKSNSNLFGFFYNRFPRISEAKIKEGIFVGPQIWKVLKDSNFKNTLTAVERCAWKAFEWLRANFFGDTVSFLFQKEVENLLEVYKETSCRKTLKVQFYTPIKIFSPKTLVRSVMRKANNLNRI